MALLQSMDLEQQGSVIAAHTTSSQEQGAALAQQQEQRQEQQKQEQERDSPIRRAGTPCPAALRWRRQQQDGSIGRLILLPDRAETSRRFIPLEPGTTTVVGRCKKSGIRDHHVSRRHVEITAPEEGDEGFAQGHCRIKYIGRNCRVVLIGGILLKSGQEVPAAPGTRVVLNYNNKGLPRYSYTLLPANNLPATTPRTAHCSVGMGAAGAGDGRPWRGGPVSSSHRLGDSDMEMGSGRKQPFHGDAHLHAYNRPSRYSTIASKQQRPRPGGRFRKEAQEKLQKERDEIFSKFADLKFL
ncbi:unnamed protein product [Ectocarpus sp. CCAP 1310/34]|nr:unnamed protein product [Ectocarpus sp. CCAP 1310/34]